MNTNTQGKLTMAANAIGNSNDIPLRTIEAVKNADLLVFEEDRPARVILKQAGVHKEYLRYNEHHQKDTLTEVRNFLKKGKHVVFCSDQGCPSLDDPGDSIAKIAYETNAKIEVIPGPSSLTSAISACPFPVKNFIYLGFLPRKPELRDKELKKYKSLKLPLVILDTPYRLTAVLNSISAMFGPDHQASLSLNISLPDEAYLSGPIKRLKAWAQSNDKKMNFVLIVS